MQHVQETPPITVYSFGGTLQAEEIVLDVISFNIQRFLEDSGEEEWGIYDENVAGRILLAIIGMREIPSIITKYCESYGGYIVKEEEIPNGFRYRLLEYWNEPDEDEE